MYGNKEYGSAAVEPDDVYEDDRNYDEEQILGCGMKGCLMPGYHYPSECYTAEMVEQEEMMEPHIDPAFAEYDEKVRAAMEGHEDGPERWTADWVGSWGKTRQFDILNQHGDTMCTIQLTEDDDMKRVIKLITSAPELQEEIEKLKGN